VRGERDQHRAEREAGDAGAGGLDKPRDEAAQRGNGARGGGAGAMQSPGRGIGAGS
jgi:hypothetical protein